MSEKNKPELNTSNSNNEFSITREFNAPLSIVWKAWTESERLAEWWGPKGFKMNVRKLDFRRGGTFRYSMLSPDGSEMWGRFEYCEINEPEYFEFIVSFTDKEGNITNHPMAPNWPLEVMNKATFIEQHGKTIITLKAYPINATAIQIKTFTDSFKGLQHGLNGTFDQLDEYLANTQKQLI